ncbi:L-xylulose 5-phosphate 3-epimerase [Sphaerochaeta associata]|uniref:L-ribulose-5-phosphate 3-epimerase n=1 Tax=Sphaerochaeta associata TaxID=1129264 RepID=A0ABY4D8H5_9SPIR|nr:L-ribulose-5-phosphate 3-epimerase [Sphaerochaeta associata]NCB71226.1 L-ribulose-5-phosphate 3-epimerase [Clostridia bacterium]UOM50441.1 L-ribulose-5-phosphate 3-epimerase [Sphaerochaeta associata]SMP41744.1 L-xylulose 5-phosphate 3-epimerase [Sphaerochaeta associata]
MLGNHLLGLYEKALDPKFNWHERFAKAKQLGFDFLEISIDETDERLTRLDWSLEQIEEFRHAALVSGMTCQSMCLSVHRRFPFGSKDPAVREKAHELLLKAVDFCNHAGVRVIQLAGYDVYYEPSTPQSVMYFRQAMAWAAKVAEQKQVMLAMEIMDTPFLNSISKHMAYEAMINSPWYKVYPDIGNLSAWPENDVDFELERGISSIVGVHLKDTLSVTESFPGKFKCVPFGSGCVDFSKRFAQLERLNYTGPYMMEMWYEDVTFSESEVLRSRLWMEEQFKKGIEMLAASKATLNERSQQ